MSYISPVFDVTKFGAVGDGSTNDYAAISSALTAALASDGTLYFPQGRYRINTALSFSNATHNITLKGDGPNVSVIVVGATGVNGVNFNFDQVGGGQPYGLVIEDLGFACTVAPAGTAIVVSANPGSGGVSNEHQLPTVTIRNTHVRSDYANSGGQYTWSNGVDITDCWNVCMTDCYLSGSAAGNVWTNLTGKGIALHRSCVNSHFLNCHCNFWATGFFYDTGSGDDDPNTEGLFFSNCSFVAVRRGVSITGNANATINAGNPVTAGSFVAGKRYKIVSAGTTNFTAIGAPNNNVGTYFTATGVGAGTGTAYLRSYDVARVALLSWTGGLVEMRAAIAGFDLDHVEGILVTGMEIIHNEPSGTLYGIRCSTCSDAAIRGVEFFAIDYGIFTTNTCKAVSASGCVFRGGTTHTTFGSGTTESTSYGHVFYDASPAGANNGAAQSANSIRVREGMGALVKLNNDQSIPTFTSTETDVSWESARFDDLNIWASGTPLRLTVPAGVTRVRLTACIRWASNSTGRRMVKIKELGGAVWATDDRLAADAGDCALSTPVLSVSGGTHFYVTVAQTSGGALNLRNVEGTSFGMEIIG
jgi:hypothetical protein